MLNRFTYWEREKSGEEWEVEPLTFGKFNLVVGRNAAGKTRLLKAIARAAGELSGEVQAGARASKFELGVEDSSAEGKTEWARRAQYLPFAGPMDLKRFDPTVARLDLASVFRMGREKFGESFKDRTLQQVAAVGYPLREVRVTDAARSGGLEVKEERRTGKTPFRRLSQAQQRTLTFLTFLTFLENEARPATVLVDDFAEGLDFEHAARLTNLVLDGYAASQLQFILTSNDRYVMNAVPLEHWTVLVEEGTVTRVFNYQNSRQKFDDFKFTGLNNFDFFSMDFAREEA